MSALLRKLPAEWQALAIGLIWSVFGSVPKFGAPLLGWGQTVLLVLSLAATTLGIVLMHRLLVGARRRRLLNIGIACWALALLMILAWISFRAWGPDIVSAPLALLYMAYVTFAGFVIGLGQEAVAIYFKEHAGFLRDGQAKGPPPAPPSS